MKNKAGWRDGEIAKQPYFSFRANSCPFVGRRTSEVLSAELDKRTEQNKREISPDGRDDKKGSKTRLDGWMAK
jgi:hypothetical protein